MDTVAALLGLSIWTYALALFTVVVGFFIVEYMLWQRAYEFIHKPKILESHPMFIIMWYFFIGLLASTIMIMIMADNNSQWFMKILNDAQSLWMESINKILKLPSSDTRAFVFLASTSVFIDEMILIIILRFGGQCIGGCLFAAWNFYNMCRKTFSTKKRNRRRK